MRPELSYIMYDTSYHERIFNIITFAHFEEGGLVENKQYAEEDE